MKVVKYICLICSIVFAFLGVINIGPLPDGLASSKKAATQVCVSLLFFLIATLIKWIEDDKKPIS